MGMLRTLSQDQINSAILDALPAHIAMVNTDGVILFVNQAWKRFAKANAFKGPRCGMGSSYIKICEESHENCATEALTVAEGLCAVLNGSQKCFTWEYSCHAPNEFRWFQVMITPISQTENIGAVIMHLNITGQYLTEEARKLSHQVFESSPDHIAVVGCDYRYRQVNHTYEMAHGLSRQEIVGMPMSMLLGEDVFQEIVKPYFDRALAGETVGYEFWINFRVLKRRFMMVTYTPLHTGDRAIDSIVVIAKDLTDRKLADEALVKSEGQRRLAMGAAKVGTWTWDITTKRVLWSENVEELFGVSHGTFDGTYQAYLDLIHPSDQSAVNDAILKTINHYDPFNIEHRIVWPDQTIHWMSCQGCLFRDSGGKPLWMSGTIIDVTKRKQAEEAFNESQAKYEGIIHTAMDAVVTIDEHQQIIVFNPAAETMFKCSAENAIGASLDQFLPRRFRDAHRRYIKEFDHCGIIPRPMGYPGMVVYGCRANGEEFPIEASISKVDIGDNKLYTVILRDITSRFEAEQALQRSEERLELALKSANLGVWDWNPQTSMGHHDKRWLNMLGYNVDELDGRFDSWKQCLHPQDLASVLQNLHDHLDNLTPIYQTEYRLRMKNGNWKWILDTGKVVSRDSTGQPLRVIGTHQDITDRKTIERELNKEREFVSAVLETSGALVVVLDPEARIVRFNHACETLTGYTVVEMKDKIIWDVLLLPEEIPAIKKTFQDLCQGGPSTHFEHHWVTKDQDTKWITGSYTTLVNDNGEVEYIIGTGIDITERRKAEETIDRLWRHNELILHSMGEGIYGIDIEGKITFFNAAAEKLTGWTSEELLDQVAHAVLHHTKSDGTPFPWHECPIYLSLKNGETHQVATNVFWRQDGSSFPVEYTSTPIYGEHETIEGAVVTFRDITDRKKSEEALQISEKRFQAFMNHSPAVAFLKDKQGRYVYVNQGFERQLNFNVGSCLGKTDHQLFPPEVARAFRHHSQKISSISEVVESEETTLDNRGEIRSWLMYTFPVYSGSEEKFLGGVALDITERKHAEESLRQREEELQALGGQLISAQEDERRRLSHELHDDMNQRLAILALSIQTVQHDLPPANPMNQTLQSLYEQVSSLSDDVRHLAYQLHPSILDDLGLEVALQSFVKDFSKWEKIPITFTSRGLKRNLSQDVASCLYRVTQESLRNMAKHAEASQVAVSLQEEHPDITLRIKDDGKGFDVEAVRSGRHGLGLISMQERARLVHGTLSVNSSPERGTEICLVIPFPKISSGKKK
ncbi:PAS domain-containing sensor histidine kinase [Candidatus Nitrospira salsa]